MLVLSRHRNEQITIGHNVVITVVDIRGDKCRLGIEAPREVPVHRREVHDAINRLRDQELKDAKEPEEPKETPDAAA